MKKAVGLAETIVLMNRLAKIDTDLESKKETALFYNLFHTSKIGQVIINKNLEILYANQQMEDCFQTDAPVMSKQSFGDAFHCAELRYDIHRCGEGEHCINCGVRRAVRQILLNDVSVQDIIQYSFHVGYRSINKWFQLNGSQITWIDDQYAFLAFVDISEMKREEKLLKKKLTLDLATGTLNKTSLMSTLHRMMEAETTSGDFTICMIDFDNFKILNDEYGHLMGDKVLEIFAEIARSHIRTQDIIGRYGGEEFIFVFYETSQKQALQVLKRIHEELEEYFNQEIKIPVTFSAGAIYVESINGLTQCTDLITDVDRMLYRAKKHGRGRAMSSHGEFVFTNSVI